MKCSKCGEVVNENQGFCLKCGNPIQVTPDFNSIESELASSVLELLEEDEEKDSKIEELSEEEPMITVDVPYDEINMEIKMVDINRNQSEKLPVEKNTKTDEKSSISNKREASSKKEESKKKKKIIITLSVIAAIILIVAVIALVFVISDLNEKKTYDGNYERAVEARDNKEYEEAIEYALSAVRLATSNIEEINARKLLKELYESINRINDGYAENLYELINLGEALPENYLALVRYYNDNEMYTKINDVVVKITDDKIFDVLSNYIPAAPVAEQESGGYTGYVVVKLTAEDGNKIFYTLNAEDNLNAGVEYRDGVKILGEESAKLTCYAVDKNGVESKRTTYEYTIEQGKLNGPAVTPASGSYTEFQLITVEVPEGAKAYYTTDGTDPTSESDEYTEPIIMPRGTSKFKFIVYDSFGLPTAITTESYNLKIARALSINDAIKIVEAKLVNDEIMDEEYNTVYGTMGVAYEKTVIIGKDEFYIILATEYSSDESVIGVTIYGVNTYDSSINMDIIDANGEYVLPLDDDER
ncbi:MAG: chitobiase/beta-hexosaminidase C-terminal domain-containing protein [Lachnospiraceae bacterium]|nr:chitobiase/beta-hexosaminidase C-terminal domain-containing protein [Lachnospiraceae bacterium]